MSRLHTESHSIERVGWLRAAVLGANDGIVSTASLIVGVAAAAAGKPELIVAGAAGLAAGALSMAAGEYVSVSSQSDTEQADLARERKELETQPEFELKELAATFEKRGVEPALARKVAQQMTRHDALDAHAREELGISSITSARPLQAAFASALTFAVGAVLPLIAVLVSPLEYVSWTVVASSLVFLALLGFLGAKAGGAPAGRAIARVVFWGALAMAVTAGVGAIFGAVA
jgi:VIT1/CCC1 family predicted Fe2+/Mn2+ transporter